MRGGFAYCNCGYYHELDGRHEMLTKAKLEELKELVKMFGNDNAEILGKDISDLIIAIEKMQGELKEIEKKLDIECRCSCQEMCDCYSSTCRSIELIVESALLPEGET